MIVTDYFLDWWFIGVLRTETELLVTTTECFVCGVTGQVNLSISLFGLALILRELEEWVSPGSRSRSPHHVLKSNCAKLFCDLCASFSRSSKSISVFFFLFRYVTTWISLLYSGPCQWDSLLALLWYCLPVLSRRPPRCLC